METQEATKSQSNAEQKVQFWRDHNSQPQTILQSPNNVLSSLEKVD
jgi:hypothetical protein